MAQSELVKNSVHSFLSRKWVETTPIKGKIYPYWVINRSTINDIEKRKTLLSCYFNSDPSRVKNTNGYIYIYIQSTKKKKLQQVVGGHVDFSSVWQSMNKIWNSVTAVCFVCVLLHGVTAGVWVGLHRNVHRWTF